MRRISKYGLFQLLGWLSFALFNIYIAALTRELNKTVLLMNVFIAMLGLFITHLFRNYIRTYQLNTWPTEKLLLRIALILFFMSLLYHLTYYTCLYFFLPSALRDFNMNTLTGSFVSVYFLFGIWSLIYFSWTYVENNRKRQLEALQMEATMKDLEIRNLRSSLQPHFIFNALNSIRALVDENPELARKAITQISNILRHSITNQEPCDTLENEVRLTEDYLSLEKIRFEDRLHFSKDIQTETLTVQVPAMMLQTLAENAIKHGISRNEKGGSVHIRSWLEKEYVCIEIRNTGILKTDTLHENSLGFGLHSTRERLKFIYGHKAMLNISQDGNQVVTRVQINLK
ncbi:MAG TPA: histidine kinase [Chitinophagaceae bacterium]|nr:histidine kinase [Chitinophagaceae bacterium]HNF70812.1 histidine kinase [Chitinophagaceae bacterium]